MTTTHTERAIARTSSTGTTKGIRIGIWLSTALFAAMFTLSGLAFLAGPPEVVTNFHHLGYPDYFRQLLGIAKLLGVAALVLPMPTPTLREWAYAGLTFTCIAAASSHVMSGDSIAKAIPSLLALALLLTSYFLRLRVARDGRVTHLIGGDAP